MPEPAAPNRSTLWGSVIADEVVRCGVRDVVLSPGSRSTPLVLAFAADDRVRVAPLLDERSAAHYALGLARGTGAPVVVLTTSGTAAANLLPAVLEASHAGVPLVALTADRPRRLRGTDANQTIDQVGLFGTAVRACSDLPEADPDALEALREAVATAVGRALGPLPGPVHLNVPLDKPLEPTPVEGDVPVELPERAPLGWRGRPDGAPFVALPGPADPDPERLEALAASLTPRTLLVAGASPRPHEDGTALLALARATGLPLLADPLSGARFGAGARSHTLSAYDLVLDEAPAALVPERIVRFGGPPTSSRLLASLAAWRDVPQTLVGAPGGRRDHLDVGAATLDGPITRVAGRLAEVGRIGSATFLEAWREADALARKASVGSESFDGTLADAVVGALPDGACLFVGNSLPIRLVDTFAAARETELVVHGNRGVSGIDGLVATALGVATGIERPTVALLGDLSLLYDGNGLEALTQGAAPVVFVVLNNDGGGIFEHLPIAGREPAFTRYFVTPHGRDLAHLAALHGIAHSRVGAAGLADAVTRALVPGEGQLLEVSTHRGHDRRAHGAARARVREALAGSTTLTEGPP